MIFVLFFCSVFCIKWFSDISSFSYLYHDLVTFFLFQNFTHSILNSLLACEQSFDFVFVFDLVFFTTVSACFVIIFFWLFFDSFSSCHMIHIIAFIFSSTQIQSIQTLILKLKFSLYSSHSMQTQINSNSDHKHVQILSLLKTLIFYLLASKFNFYYF